MDRMTVTANRILPKCNIFLPMQVAVIEEVMYYKNRSTWRNNQYSWFIIWIEEKLDKIKFQEYRTKGNNDIEQH